MKKDISRGLNIRGGGTFYLLQMLLLCLAAVASCNDQGWNSRWHEQRIGLTEFLELEEELKQAQMPATQPAEVVAEANNLIDQELSHLYRLGPSDVISVTVSEVTQLVGGRAGVPALARVDHNGEVDLPVVGQLKVGGLELEFAEDIIKDAYVPKVFREAVVNVAVVDVDMTNVLVTGAVQSPGLIPLRRTQRNLLYALHVAGGISDAASGRVILNRLRQPGQTQEFHINSIAGLRDVLTQDPLDDGDIINVEPAPPTMVTVGGLVNRPGSVPAPANFRTSVLQLLAASGGLRTDLYGVREATLIRPMEDEPDIQVKLDLDRIQLGQDPNIRLANHDILWVPHTPSTWVQEWINSHIFLRGGAAATVTYNVTGMDYLNTYAREESGGGGGNATSLENSFDPLGYLQRNALLQAIPTR